MPNICRLCGAENEFGMYCGACVPTPELRNELNRRDPSKTNMMLLDFRAQNELSGRKASYYCNVDDASWRTAERDPKKGLTMKVMEKIAHAVGIDVETLFNGYLVLRSGKTWNAEKIAGVVGQTKAPKKPRAVHLRPGESQHLLALDCREAEKAGYGHSYGKWRAGVII